MQFEPLQRTWIHDLKDLQSADRQIVDALRTLVAAAPDGELGDALRDHLRETENQLARLEAIAVGAAGSAAARRREGHARPPEALEQSPATEAERATLAATPRCASPLDEAAQMAARWTPLASAESRADQDELASLQTPCEDEFAPDRTTSRLRGRRRPRQRDARVADPR